MKPALTYFLAIWQQKQAVNTTMIYTYILKSGTYSQIVAHLAAMEHEV